MRAAVVRVTCLLVALVCATFATPVKAAQIGFEDAHFNVSGDAVTFLAQQLNIVLDASKVPAGFSNLQCGLKPRLVTRDDADMPKVALRCISQDSRVTFMLVERAAPYTWLQTAEFGGKELGGRYTNAGVNSYYTLVYDPVPIPLPGGGEARHAVYQRSGPHSPHHIFVATLQRGGRTYDVDIQGNGYWPAPREELLATLGALFETLQKPSSRRELSLLQ